MRTRTIATPFGVTAILYPSRKTGGRGHGRVLQDIGSFAGKSSMSTSACPCRNTFISILTTLLCTCSINTTAWTAGSTLLSLGLSASQAIGCMVGVALISALVAVFAGWPGSHLYLGFTVLCRASWGMRGGFWPVMNRIVTACVWMGIQAYWGGQGQRAVPAILHPLLLLRGPSTA